MRHFLIVDLFSRVAKEDEKHSSIVVIFSCWKTMIGTAVAALPWTF